MIAGFYENQITSIQAVSDFDFAVCHSWGIAGGWGPGVPVTPFCEP